MLGDWSAQDRLLPDALAHAIIDLIEANLIPAGACLPPQRAMAHALGVSRGTVTTAVEALEARGFVASSRGSGTRVRSGHGMGSPNDGRMFSFTNAPTGVTDLSTGALPASDVAVQTLGSPPADLSDYLLTDGYFPAGLPILRKAIADQLTQDGIPTTPAEILVTCGAQQATWLAILDLLAPGDLALVEDPTYRGGLAALRSLGVRAQGIPMTAGGIDVDLLAQAMRRQPSALYCQTSIHNPTGQTTRRDVRTHVADLVNRHGLVTIEDACSCDLTLQGPAASTLATEVDPQLLIMIGTLSKLFWGGIRVGWLRTTPTRIRSILERRKVGDLASSIVDQLYAVRLLARTDEARRERCDMLNAHLRTTEAVTRELLPEWDWQPIKGGSGLWVDIGTDATTVAERAKRASVALVAGPAFSPHNGHQNMLRLPVWHDADQLQRALESVADALKRTAHRKP
ncbi:MAG: PLP-dependent aminotransferase family protein [Arachnia sp.]